MAIKVKNAGVWATVQNLYTKQSGLWVPVQKVFVKNAGAWVEAYAAEVVVTVASNVNNLNLQSLFTAADWSSTKKKRVVINSGVIVGGVGSSSAILTGTGRGGLLQLDNGGDIRGYGGAANGGAGGHAINVQQAGLTINNAGAIRGGGGGGGRGGSGGPGYYNYTAVEGPYYAKNGDFLNPAAGDYYWVMTGSNGTVIWNGSNIFGTYQTNGGPSSSGGYTYYRVTQQINGTNSYYSIRREYTATAFTTGGSGGNGGPGRGHNQSPTTGVAGSAGGTNAGTGGTGGTGGEWGTAGNTGGTGGAGNNGAGTVGQAGGAAGFAITGLARTLNNTGTIQGAT